MMETIKVQAVIGTNSWGGKAYGKAVRGSYVADSVIKEAMREAADQGLFVYDLARDYGLGKAQKMFGDFAAELGGEPFIISAKYTPFTHYKKNCVRKSLEKDLADFQRSYVDIYWLHLPTDIEQHLAEIIELYRVMIAVAKRHGLTVPQVAEAYCVNKGIVPICGCRKPKQVAELAEAVSAKLTAEEMRCLEEAAAMSGAKVLGHDLFRFAVLKKRS